MKKKEEDTQETIQRTASLYFTLPQSPHLTLAKCKAKQDPQSLQRCTYTEGAAASNTFIRCQAYVTRGLALGREPELGHLLSHNRASVWLCKEKTLKPGFSPWNFVAATFPLLFWHMYWSCNTLPSPHSSSCSEVLGLCLWLQSVTTQVRYASNIAFQPSYGTRRGETSVL